MCSMFYLGPGLWSAILRSEHIRYAELRRGCSSTSCRTSRSASSLSRFTAVVHSASTSSISTAVAVPVPVPVPAPASSLHVDPASSELSTRTAKQQHRRKRVPVPVLREDKVAATHRHKYCIRGSHSRGGGAESSRVQSARSSFFLPSFLSYHRNVCVKQSGCTRLIWDGGQIGRMK